MDTKDGHKVDTKMDLTDIKEPKVGIWGGGGLGSGEVWGEVWEVCCLGRYVIWGGLQNVALVLALSLVLASCKNRTRNLVLT